MGYFENDIFYPHCNFFLLFSNQAYARISYLSKIADLRNFFQRCGGLLKTLITTWKEKAVLIVLVQKVWYHHFDIIVHHWNAYRYINLLGIHTVTCMRWSLAYALAKTTPTFFVQNNYFQKPKYLIGLK